MKDVLLAKGYNPFDGVSPNFGPFNGILESKIQTFLAIAWACAFVYVAFHLVMAIARVARSRQGYGDDLSEARESLIKTAAAAVGLAAVPVIYAVLVSG